MYEVERLCFELFLKNVMNVFVCFVFFIVLLLSDNEGDRLLFYGL